MIALIASPATGQLSDLSTLPPRGVNRYGAIEVTWVRSQLGGGRLFQIASPTVFNRNDVQTGQIPVEVRAKNIEDLIQLEMGRFRQQAIAQLFTPNDGDTPRKVQVLTSTLNQLPVLQVAAPSTSRPLTVATVTATDAKFYSETPDAIIQRWRRSLAAEIAKAEDLYSPQTFPARLQQTALIPLGLVCLTGLLLLCRAAVGRRKQQLQMRYAAEVEATAPSTEPVETTESEVKRNPLSSETGVPKSLPTLLQQQFSLANRIDLCRLLRWFLFWLIIVSWYLGIYAITTRLPILMQLSNQVLIQPLRLLIVWFLISLMIRVSTVLIRRSTNAWKDNPRLIFGDVRRQVLRSQTIAGALQGLTTCILVFLGILFTLTQFGLPVSSILAGSALFGLAISFGAQNLVKDVVNGCLILLEDQFAVGDVITANNESGVVEKLNLRLTQLRNIDGELISIPNSSITLVKNQTSSWSRVNIGIEVAYRTDLDHAIAVIEKVATQLSQDPNWQSLILEPPQVLGVDAFGDNSITIRVWIQTEPLQQWSVGREFRRRLKLAFDQEGIAIPLPQRSVWFENDMAISTHSAPPPEISHSETIETTAPEDP